MMILVAASLCLFGIAQSREVGAMDAGLSEPLTPEAIQWVGDVRVPAAGGAVPIAFQNADVAGLTVIAPGGAFHGEGRVRIGVFRGRYFISGRPSASVIVISAEPAPRAALTIRVDLEGWSEAAGRPGVFVVRNGAIEKAVAVWDRQARRIEVQAAGNIAFTWFDVVPLRPG